MPVGRPDNQVSVDNLLLILFNRIELFAARLARVIKKGLKLNLFVLLTIHPGNG
jgi:hypothetical protein